MKDRIKDHFEFTSKEQRGIIILLGIMLLSFLANIFLPYIIPAKKFNIEPFKSEVGKFLESIERQDSALAIKKSDYHEVSGAPEQTGLENFIASPFYFNPNKLTEDEWLKIGMNKRIVTNIARYKSKGGVIRDQEGFRKIYGMTEEIYKVLEPYLQFDNPKSYQNAYLHDTVNYHKSESFNRLTPATILIELNSADSASLLALNGIGPSFAGRIIRYRDKLGGYARPEQLLEIKGLDSARLQLFQQQITINPDLIRKIDLNEVVFKELLKHPYFEYYLVKAIFKKKDEIKEFDSVGQIRKIPVMYEELYEKISPYLKADTLAK
jgi:competence protein ComEA